MGDALNTEAFLVAWEGPRNPPHPRAWGGGVGWGMCSAPLTGAGAGGRGAALLSEARPPPPLSSLCSCPWPGLSPSPSPSAPPFSVSPHVVPGEQQGLAEAHCGRALSSGVSEPGPAGPLPGLGAGEDRQP